MPVAGYLIWVSLFINIMKYKIDDRLIITDNIYGHQFNVGASVFVKSINDGFYRVKSEWRMAQYFVHDLEVELLDK